MTMMQRAASVSAAILVLAVAGFSTPGLANELDTTAITTAKLVAPITTTILPAAPILPAPAASTTQTDDDVTAATVSADPVAPHYASLEAAIDAQDTAIGDDSVRCLAAAVYFEAKGEPLSGQLAVAEVILNRAKSGRFPSDLCRVVTQPGQFSFVRGGMVPTLDTGRAAYRTALSVAKVAIANAWDSPAPAALYFHARRVSPGWNRAQVAAIGNHVFYR